MWPVNGFGWPLKIKRIEAQITLPSLVIPDSVIRTGSAGKYPALEREKVISRVRDNGIHFTTLEPLEEGSGVLVSVTWPRGFFSVEESLLTVPGKSEPEQEELLSVPSALSVPSEDEGDFPPPTAPQEPDDEELLAVPQALSVPGTSEHATTAPQAAPSKKVQLDDTLFTVHTIDSLITSVEISSDQVLDVGSTITFNTPHSDPKQGIILQATQKPVDIYSVFANSKPATAQETVPGKFYLVAPEPLSFGQHHVIVNYAQRDTATLGKNFDRIDFRVPSVSAAIAANALVFKVRYPDLMLPKSARLNAFLGSTEVPLRIEHSQTESTVQVPIQVPSGSEFLLRIQLPKGFLNE